jgi:threonine synthase
MASSLSCSGCGWAPPDDDPFPFRCAHAGSGDDVDHVIVRTLDPSLLSWPTGQEANPFVRYRRLFRSHHLATARGMTDGEYVDLVERLDKEIAAVDGRGFVVTPFGRAPQLSERLGFSSDGGVWVKDETGNVSGSHKARHLMGLAIHLEVVERLGLASTRERRLAIASCGNAALGAAVVARAVDRQLDVFVPTWADPLVIDQLRGLGATITVCPRQEGVSGDPTYHALQRAIADGAIPFTCQGPDNGLTIEGGETLGYEIADGLREVGTELDAIFVQVGGGALASSTIQGMDDARILWALEAVPRFHTVQTRGGFPLWRGYEAVRLKTYQRIAESSGFSRERDAFEDTLEYARRHRSEFMWPWEEEPKSIATGILDDETYDWFAVVRGMIETAGYPVVVSEDTLRDANDMARESTSIDVDHTGSAGLAGLMELLKRNDVGSDERVAVLFTGATRREGEGT